MLSKRLRTVLDHLKKGRVLYDVGSDHAYLPIAALKEGVVQKAYAVDNKLGPLEAARKTAKQEAPGSALKLLHSEGIDDLPDEADLLSIAGLGGKTIHKILDRKHHKNLKRMVLQPNNHPEMVRFLTRSNALKIVEEDVVEENGELYIVIVLERGEQTLSAKELWGGPVLMQKRPAAYKEALEKEHGFLSRLIEDIPDEDARKPLQEKKALLEEVLYEWRKD